MLPWGGLLYTLRVLCTHGDTPCSTPLHFPSACLSPYKSFDQNFRSVGHGVIILPGTWYTDVTSNHAESLGFCHRSNTSPSRPCSSDVGPTVTSSNDWAFAFLTRERWTQGCGPSSDNGSWNVLMWFCVSAVTLQDCGLLLTTTALALCS